MATAVAEKPVTVCIPGADPRRVELPEGERRCSLASLLAEGGYEYGDGVEARVNGAPVELTTAEVKAGDEVTLLGEISGG